MTTEENNWKEKYEKAQAKCDQLQRQVDRYFKENNNLYNRIAKLTEDKLQEARKSGL
jgi:hypothetical protein